MMMLVLFILCALIGVAWFVPIMWAFVAVFVMYLILDKMVEDKIARMTPKTYDEVVMAYHGDEYDEFPIVRNPK